MYHYQESGLPNIHLISGYNLATEDGEEYVSFDNFFLLHETIGRHIIYAKNHLHRLQFKFLRKELGMDIITFSEHLGITPDTAKDIENGQLAISKSIDVTLRTMYIKSIADKDTLQECLDTIPEPSLPPKLDDLRLNYTDSAWIIAQ